MEYRAHKFIFVYSDDHNFAISHIYIKITELIDFVTMWSDEDACLHPWQYTHWMPYLPTRVHLLYGYFILHWNETLKEHMWHFHPMNMYFVSVYFIFRFHVENWLHLSMALTSQPFIAWVYFPWRGRPYLPHVFNFNAPLWPFFFLSLSLVIIFKFAS